MTTTVRVPRRAAPRRAQILEAARLLFAAEGIDAVTTNRIAAEAGISPGNLYYWFPSKTEIVRALFADWSSRMRVIETPADDPGEALRMLWARATEQDQPDPDYAFFLRDLLPLLHADPLLAETYREQYAHRRDTLIAIAEHLIRAGLLERPAPPVTVRDLVSLLWLTAETAHPFAQTTGDGQLDARQFGRAIMQPLLTRVGRRVLGLPEREGTR